MTSIYNYGFVRPRADGYMPKATAADGTRSPILDMTNATTSAQATVAWYFSIGFELGWLRGRDDLLAEQLATIQAAQTDAARVVHAVAGTPPLDELEELRGRPERAQRIREAWRRSGLRGGAA